ncbi:MAG: putative esterase/lipase [Alphaproteobacteria bacterium]|nr:putative esterase/lipase [Alphaproteobacteria bacterium]
MSFIYRQLTQAALDAAYNNRAHVPHFMQIVERFQAQSERARQTLKPRLDLAYGRDARQKLDFFPAAAKNAPLFVFIHGGYWQSLDNKPFSFMATPLNAAGIACAAMTYDLCPTISMTRLTQQIREGLLWLHAQAHELGFDADRIFVGGHSAGGHLATMMLLTDWTGYGAPADLVKGGLSISGLYELEPVRLAYVNEALKLDASEARALSPIHHLPHDAAALPPLLLAVGAAELPEFVRQQRDFASAARQRNWSVGEIELEQHNHFSVLETLASREVALFPRLARLIQTGSVL